VLCLVLTAYNAFKVNVSSVVNIVVVTFFADKFGVYGVVV